MHFTFHPQRSDEPLTLHKTGDVLTVNDEEFDFSTVAEGDILPSAAIKSKWFVGPVTRENGALKFNILLPHCLDAAQFRRFPVETSQSRDGHINLPSQVDYNQ